jgi:hypothetical protein
MTPRSILLSAAVVACVGWTACSGTPHAPTPTPLEPISSYAENLPDFPYEFYALRGTGGRIILYSTDRVIRTVPRLLDGGTESRTVLEAEAPFSIADVILLNNAMGEELLIARTVAAGAARERIYVIRPEDLSAALIADVGFNGTCTFAPSWGTVVSVRA